MQFGLKDEVVLQIISVLSSFPQIDEVIIYGSRAKGNFKPGSDIDLTIKGKNLRHADLNTISLKLDELLLPQTFDLSIFEHIDNEQLLEHIKRVGTVFYKRQVGDSLPR